jgi:hypothetical protein
VQHRNRGRGTAVYKIKRSLQNRKKRRRHRDLPDKSLPRL